MMKQVEWLGSDMQHLTCVNVLSVCSLWCWEAVGGTPTTQIFITSRSRMPQCICTTNWLNLLFFLPTFPLTHLTSDVCFLSPPFIYFCLLPSGFLSPFNLPSPPLFVSTLSSLLFLSSSATPEQPSLRIQPALWPSRPAPSRWWSPDVRQRTGNQPPPSSGWRRSEEITRPAPQMGQTAQWRCAANIGWSPRRQITTERWPAWLNRGRRNGRGLTFWSSLWSVSNTHTFQITYVSFHFCALFILLKVVRAVSLKANTEATMRTHTSYLQSVCNN